VDSDAGPAVNLLEIKYRYIQFSNKDFCSKGVLAWHIVEQTKDLI
jgi:hypothetical protein